MTDDLVKRLWENGVDPDDADLMIEAADRIEKLEAALTHIYAWYPVSVSDPVQTIKDIREFARNTLGDENDDA